MPVNEPGPTAAATASSAPYPMPPSSSTSPTIGISASAWPRPITAWRRAAMPSRHSATEQAAEAVSSASSVIDPLPKS